jgi:hypothetical protein
MSDPGLRPGCENSALHDEETEPRDSAAGSRQRWWSANPGRKQHTENRESRDLVWLPERDIARNRNPLVRKRGGKSLIIDIVR